MAKDTTNELLSQSIYQVYPRCYSKEGTLSEVERDLSRIRDMGFSYIYFLPLHEPGVLNRKGTMGSPYSIRDYYKIDPAYGTLDDFSRLIGKAHEMGLKVMTDIVINHTACDALWTQTHPEYYILDENGQPTRKVADWTDIIDLDYMKSDLQDELVDMMLYWARFGVDAFRCDVAPIVPLSFWERVRTELKMVNPSFVLLAESGEQAFIEHMRRLGNDISTDSELYSAFDICYCYDICEFFNPAVTDVKELPVFARALNYQAAVLPKNAVKAWYLENHDQMRVFSKVRNRKKVRNWTAFILLLKGMGFVYAGQEAYASERPSLFEKDEIDWSTLDPEFEKLICACNSLKKRMYEGSSYIECRCTPYENVMGFTVTNGGDVYDAFFDVHDMDCEVACSLEDGVYENLIDESDVVVKAHRILVDRPVVVRRK